jgi:ubiquinone/menaquinone biosynthesis C-methylase UbiE
MKIKKKLKTLGERYTKNADFILKVLDHYHIKEGAKVLDIGTGRGIMTIILALNNFQVITGEPEGADWGNWKESARKVGVLDSIKFKPLRAEELPFPDNSFDAVFLYTSFHHISADNRRKALREILRVLKNKGLIVIIELTEQGVKRLRKRHPSHPNPVDPRDFNDELPREFQIIKGKLLNAYLYQKR